MPYKDISKAKENKRIYAKRNSDKIATYQKEYREQNKDYLNSQYRLASIKRLYNLDADAYLGMIKAQNNKCAICDEQETAKGRSGDVRPLCVDHDHSTGLVRALLCNKCNSLLGHAKDNIAILDKAIEYLKMFKE